MPPVLASTTAKVAASPSATGTFLPLRRPPPKVVRDVARLGRLRALGDRQACRSPCPRPAAAATSSSAPPSPRASSPRSPARPRCRTAPARRRGRSPRRRRRARAARGRARHSSPGCRRPARRDRRGPSRPPRHRVSLPSSTRRTTLVGHLSARNLRTCSLSSFWSSEKSKFMMAEPSKRSHRGTAEGSVRRASM